MAVNRSVIGAVRCPHCKSLCELRVNTNRIVYFFCSHPVIEGPTCGHRTYEGYGLSAELVAQAAREGWIGEDPPAHYVIPTEKEGNRYDYAKTRAARRTELQPAPVAEPATAEPEPEPATDPAIAAAIARPEPERTNPPGRRRRFGFA